jgi:hypothetical protein
VFCKCDATREEAILQGFLDLVERDAYAIWSLPQFDIQSPPGLGQHRPKSIAVAPLRLARSPFGGQRVRLCIPVILSLLAVLMR